MAEDWTMWPLLEVDATGVEPDAAAGVVSQALLAALERAEPFAAVIRMPAAGGRKRRVAGAAERVRMVKRLRPGLAERCHGIAFVMSADAQRENARVVRSADKVWGCPTTVTDDPARARTWARERLTVDRAPGRA